jgi:cation diffusion facilitator CzcD-associated flavoprotein CzcO
VTPGDGFLEALVMPNVEPIFSGIKKITEKGILTEDGKHHEFDILICATGYKPAFQPNWLVVNGEGKSLKEDWESYGGVKYENLLRKTTT